MISDRIKILFFFLFFFWLGKNLTLIQTKMMEESKKMIQDTSTRLEKGVEELVAVIVRPFLLL